MCACGGGGGGNITTAPTVKQAPKPVLIEAYGDSTMEGYTYLNGPGTLATISVDNQPAVLQSSLQAKYGDSVTVSNQGVSGTRAPQLVEGSDTVHLPWTQVVANSNAQIMIVNYGINDGMLRPESLDAYKAALREIADTAIRGGKIIVFEQPNPTCVNGEQFTGLDAYAEAMEDVAAEKNTPLVKNYEYLLSLPNWQDMLSDCIHPRGEMYKIEAQRMAAVIGPLVERLQK
ncbi:SGNH/GDSL hydrolase family protein [Caballeronia sp. INDeC2]|uniref:SGNH/GDSL hydrolase family protein n=1 Tax=Caballeronia sp. INDeC2 TaxID=2921747 RepID=UPI00254037E1|nr:SGNH/GDSL hydrolase family protein [Caballeronia sp. INDeC2]